MAVFLDEDSKSYIFSTRPVAGTQEMPKEWVLAIEPVPETETVYVNKLVGG